MVPLDNHKSLSITQVLPDLHTGCPQKNVAVALLLQQATATFFWGHPVGV